VLNKKHSRIKAIAGGLISFALIALVVWVVFNRQYVIDQINVWQFKPSPDVVTIGERAGLANKGLFYYYTSHPSVDSAADFNINCQRKEAKSAILGCYTGTSIYIYDVTNTRLDGIEEVTAAHEMLHAAWDRMSEAEKSSVSKLLEAQYAKLNDTELTARMDYYNRNEPGQFDNELHSIIGTEYASISPELESYYSQYFSDRKKLTDLHTSYNSVFTELSNQSDALYATLTRLGAQIDIQKNTYNADTAALSADIAAFNAEAKNGGFSSIEYFSAERQSLLNRSKALDGERVTLNNKIKTYNDDFTQYQALVIQSQALNKSIDSNVNAAPSL
jgi:hypothetical protein